MPRIRFTNRRPWRCPHRRAVRCVIRTCWRGPDDLGDALVALRREVRLQRQLAKLAPSFFDPAVIERERANREAQRQWTASWEPALAKAYGKTHVPAPPDDPYPRLPPANTQRAVDRRLAELLHWQAVAGVALDRHRHRRPHELMSLDRMAQLLKVAFDLKKMVLGLDSPNPLPEKIEYDDEFTDLKRAYGDKVEPKNDSHHKPAPGAVETGAGVLSVKCAPTAN